MSTEIAAVQAACVVNRRHIPKLNAMALLAMVCLALPAHSNPTSPKTAKQPVKSQAVASQAGPHPVPSMGAHGVIGRLAAMEECLFGKVSLDLTLKQRLANLEAQTFGRTQTGSVSKRIIGLEKIIGKSTSPLLPPIAPQLDTPSANPQEHTRPAPASADKANEEHIKDKLKDGRRKHSQGYTADAEKAFHDVLAISPYNPDACYNLGAIAEKNGDLAAALGHYRTALIANPNDMEIQQAVAEVEEEIGRRQNTPITNPLMVSSLTSGNKILRGNASEFTASGSANQPSYAPPFAAPPMVPYSIRPTAVRQPVPNVPVGQKRRFSPVARALTRTAVSAGISTVPGLGSLKCPLCRIIGGF